MTRHELQEVPQGCGKRQNGGGEPKCGQLGQRAARGDGRKAHLAGWSAGYRASGPRRGTPGLG